MHGGASTLLALLPTAFSQSHTFITFFRILSSTAALGLYHGLVFLPVMLALFGADSSEAGEELWTNEREAEMFTVKIPPTEYPSPGRERENIALSCLSCFIRKITRRPTIKGLQW